MPTYVYGCDANNTHQKVETTHGFHEDPDIRCPDCGETMHRVPQPLLSLNMVNPAIMLRDHLADCFAKKRAGKPYDKHTVTRPGGMPGGHEFHTRE